MIALSSQQEKVSQITYICMAQETSTDKKVDSARGTVSFSSADLHPRQKSCIYP